RQPLEVVGSVDLERQIQQREGRCRHSDAEKEFGREQICPGRIEKPPVPGSIEMLPLTAKLNSMASMLQRYVVRHREPAQVAPLRRIEVIAEREIHRVQIKDFRPGCTYTDLRPAGTRGWDVAVLPVLEGELEVVYQSGTQHARHAEQVLVYPVLVGNKIRRWDRDAEGTAVGVAVVGVADERGVLVIHPVVHSPTEGFPSIRRRSNRTEACNRREVRRDHVDARLIGIFEVSEEERLVLLDRTASPKAPLPPRKERIVGERVPIQARVGSDVVIPEIEISGAVIVVAAGAGDDVDRAKCRNAG